MQLGTRWSFGDEPPARLPAAMVAAIRDIESGVGVADADARRRRWTLTWLERRPHVELDDGPLLSLGADGDVVRIDDPDAD
jgi:hypothetical protein